MSYARIKLSVAGLVVLVGIGVLACAGVQKGRVYYMEVDKFLADTQLHSQRVRLCGTVAEDGLVIKTGDMRANFNLQGDQNRLPVVYHGVIPDLFKPGCDVVVEGRLDKDRVFQADQLMTKCASKYKPESKNQAGGATKSAGSAGAAASQPEGRP